MDDFKICSKCNLAKSLDQFSKHSKTVDLLQYWCKLCKKEYNRDIWYPDNCDWYIKETREYTLEHLDQHKKIAKKHMESAKRKEYLEVNKVHIAKIKSDWYQAHKNTH